MKVVIFGAKGMLGMDLCEILSHEENFEVHGFGSHEVNIADSEKVKEVLRELHPQIVINCAAYTNVDGAETEKEKASMINGTALETISKACNEIKAHLIHYSTDYVFDGTKADGYSENDATHPINEYGRSKLLGENIVQKMCTEYSIIRTSWLFGKHGKNFVDTIRNLLATKNEIKVVNDQIGSPTFTRDLAQATLDLIRSGQAHGKNIFHLTNSGICTWFDFATEIAKLTKSACRVLPCTSAEFQRPAKRPQYSILKNTRLPTLRDWKSALESYLTNKS